MPIRDYPFTGIHKGGGFTIHGTNPSPRLWIRVENPQTRISTDTIAIVDTGATTCLFPAACAIKLQYDPSSVPAIPIHTAGGTGSGRVLTTRVSVLAALPDGQADKKKILMVIGDIEVVYTDTCNEFLLGQTAFLSRFILVVNYPEKKFSIRLPQSQKQASNVHGPGLSGSSR